MLAIKCASDQLKRRLNRRLIKLAKWADIPQEERQPKERISALRSILPGSYTTYGNCHSYFLLIFSSSQFECDSGVGLNPPATSSFNRPPVPSNAPAGAVITSSVGTSVAGAAGAAVVAASTPSTSSSPVVTSQSAQPVAHPEPSSAPFTATTTVEAANSAFVERPAIAMIGGMPTISEISLKSAQAAALQLAAQSLKEAETQQFL